MARAEAGVGFAELEDSYRGGRQAATEAIERAGTNRPSLVVAFCTGWHDHEACLAGIKSVTNDAPVIGGSAIGVITNDHLGYEGHQVGVAVLPEDLRWDVVPVGNLEQGERQAGLELGRRLSVARTPLQKLLLLFYDSIKVPPPPAPVLNVSSYLLAGLEEGFGTELPLTVGAGLLGDYGLHASRQFCATHVAEQSVVAALLSGDCTPHVAVMHGCKPMSGHHTITRIDGPVVYEIDGRPALDVVDDLFGSTTWRRRMPLILVTLGVNHGAKTGPYDEASYLNRLIVSVDAESKSIVLFEADFENGTEFQFMRRNVDLMCRSAEEGTRNALERVRGEHQEPFFAMYIDCAGRSAAYSGGRFEEASVVQRIIGEGIPLLGFYSGVEIAPLLGKARGLDWTGVLLLLCREKAM